MLRPASTAAPPVAGARPATARCQGASFVGATLPHSHGGKVISLLLTLQYYKMTTKLQFLPASSRLVAQLIMVTLGVIEPP